MRTPYRGPHAYIGTVGIVRNIRVAHAVGHFLTEITSLKSGAFLMTTEFDVPSPGSEQVDGDATVQICDACGHARLAHDAIASRFCRASRDRALDRDCACANRGSTADTKKRHADSTVQRPEAPMYGRGRFSRT